MRTHRHNTGVTLIEMLVVVAVIAILTTMVIAVAGHIDNQSKENLAKSTLELVDGALGQFRDYGYNYKNPIYMGLKFPLDCNDPGVGGVLEQELDAAFMLNPGTVVIDPAAGHDPNYSGSEALYFFLNMVPVCRGTLARIDSSLITSAGMDGESMRLEIPLPPPTVKTYPLYRIVDPWGQTLRYSYYENPVEILDGIENEPLMDSPRSFPVITSSGPDRIFGTNDDIKSR